MSGLGNPYATMDDVSIIARQFWNAVEPTHRPVELTHPVKHVWLIYNIGTPMCKNKDDCKRIVKLLQNRCMTAMKMTDIPFNFLIGGDGRIYEGRGWFYQPPAFRMFPDEGGDRIDIGFISNRTKNQITYQMSRSCADLMTLGIGQKYIDETFETKEWNKIGEPIIPNSNNPFE